jgi:hypothetical protein
MFSEGFKCELKEQKEKELFGNMDKDYSNLILNILKQEFMDYWFGNPVVEIISGQLIFEEKMNFSEIKSIE